MDAVKNKRQNSKLIETMKRIRERERAGVTAASAEAGNARRSLQLLMSDLRGVVEDIPYDAAEIFDFRLSRSEPARLWIDKTAFVAMAGDGEGFRMLKDTRAGRVLLRESREPAEIAKAVMHYVAERLARLYKEREAEERTTVMPERAPEKTPDRAPPPAVPQASPASAGEGIFPSAPQITVRRSRLRSFLWFCAGFVFGAAALLVFAWFYADIAAYLARVR